MSVEKSNQIILVCSFCEHSWEENIDQIEQEKMIFKRKRPNPEVVDYRIKCPNCGQPFIVQISKDNQ